jgi:Sec-independent protein secretion pathway component TatC
VPLFLLFEVSIWIIRIQDLLRRKNKAAPAG